MIINHNLSLIGLILIGTFTSLFAQHPCGVSSNLAPLAPSELAKLKAKYFDQKSNDLKIVPIQAHAIRKEGEAIGNIRTKINLGLEQANEQFEHINMRFALCSEINLITRQEYVNDRDVLSMNFESSNEVHAAAGNPEAINMYVAEELGIDGGGLACGWATLPWWRENGFDYIFMAENCMDDNTTLSHEIGHFLGLFHTHNVARIDSIVIDSITMDTINLGIEFVDQSNCEFAGDGICDTRADPLLGFGNVNAACEYTGTAVDPLGIEYSSFPPDPTNRMSYARRSCMSRFSDTQIEIMDMWLLDRTPELGCKGLRDIILLDIDSDTETFAVGDSFDLKLDASNFAFTDEEVAIDIKVYLSRNSLLDDNDVQIAEINGLDIPKNTEFQDSFKLVLPIEYENRGVHYILVELDSENLHEESNEKNNVNGFFVFLENATSTATAEVNNAKAISSFPNPTFDEVTIKLPNIQDGVITEIYDIQGNLIEKKSHNFSATEFQLNTEGYASGLYLINLYDKKGRHLGILKMIKD